MPGIGDMAPDFTGHDFINDETFVLSDHTGEVILLSFVANW
jgi:peroxiredoxin